MTVINWIQAVLLLGMLLSGSVFKRHTGRKVRGLDGIRGWITKKDEGSGNIAAKFGE